MDKELSTNTTLSHYRIVSKLGAGGMGEVYLAQDTKLDRKVAIKFLHEEFSKDAEKLNRFVQEAKAASALNHPNILTVYEIGEVDGKNYISTELIDGKTLREHLSHKESLQLNVILKIGVQVSEALAAAHQAGIIHRDIKPENIMLRKDGYAKVLDFGLAKLTEKKTTDEVSMEGATRVFVNTTPGMVMGTVSYMSPEQARGKETDARTDIWSLGVVLYEMLAGKVPFTGETINHAIVSILEKEPLLLENVPGELQRIVRKSLTKDVEMRYQSARDLLIDLKNLHRDLDIQGELERSFIPNRETADASLENATQANTTGSAAATRSGQAPATQQITNSSSSLEYAVTQAKSHKLASAIIGLLLLGVISAAGYWSFFSSSTSQINSIAVLPFENRSGNADTDYLSDGLAESLIYRFSQFPGLKVSPTNSVLRYKGSQADVAAIARELEVDAVMSGRLAQRGDDLTISVELTDARTRKLVWAEQYPRKMSDLLATQREIATAVTQKLQLKLSGDDTRGLTKRYTDDNEAYQLYLKGRFYWNKRTTESLKKAIEQFKAASEKDPNFALAYVGLADSYLVGLYSTRGKEQEVIPLAKAYATRALDIDPSLAEAHATLGLANSHLWNWDETEKYFKRAIELNPNYPSTRHWYSRTLRALGRYEEAFQQIIQAQKADELSAVISNNVAESLFEKGDISGAMEEARRGIEIAPMWAQYRTLSHCYLRLGRKEEALANARKAAEAMEGSAVTLKILGYVQAAIGNRSEATAIVRELEHEFASGEADGRDVAVVYAGLGNNDKVFEWLEKDFQSRSSSLNELRLEVPFVPLRGDPRFKDLLRRMGLPE